MIYTPMTIHAMKVAYEAHLNQKDKAGVPYIFHPIHVAEQMTDEVTTTVALLHDVVEDTHVTFEALEWNFPQSVIQPLRLLTHEKGVPYMDYIKTIASDFVARKVKLADLEHNMDESRILHGGNETPEQLKRRKDKYLEAWSYLRDWRRRCSPDEIY